MPEIQQADIVGNYLANYYGAQDRVAKQQDAQYQRQRQMTQDAQQSKLFDQNSQMNDLNMAMAKHKNLVNLLGRATDEATFQQSLQQAALPVEQGGLGLDPSQLAHLTYAKDFKRLQQESGALGEQLDIAYKRAQIASANANTAQSYAAAEKDRAAAASFNSPAANDPESLAYAATIFRRTGQMPPLGQGKEGTAARKEVLRIAAQQAAAEGGGADGDVAAFADFSGARRGLGALGARAANIDSAAKEADQFADLSIASSKALPRGNFVPLNRAIQLVQSGASNPQLKDFVIKAQGLANAAATVAGRGTPNQMLQEEYMRQLSSATGPAAFEAAARAIQQEAKAVVQSTQDVHDEMVNRIRGGNKPKTEATHDNDPMGLRK